MWTKYLAWKYWTHFFNARGSDPTEMGLDSLEVFGMFWTQQLKSCLVGQFSNFSLNVKFRALHFAEPIIETQDTLLIQVRNTYSRSQAKREQPPFSLAHQFRDRVCYHGHKLLQLPVVLYVALADNFPHYCWHQPQRRDDKCQRGQGNVEFFKREIRQG